MAAIRKKLVAVGSQESGRTQMLYACTRNQPFIDFFPTVMENYVADIEVDGKLVELALWDVVGLSTACDIFDSHSFDSSTTVTHMHWVGISISGQISPL